MYLGSIHGVMSTTTKAIVYTLLVGLLVGIVMIILIYGAKIEMNGLTQTQNNTA